MTASQKSFDISSYITDPISDFPPVKELVVFTPSAERNDRPWEVPLGFPGIPGYENRPTTFPLCIMDYVVQRQPRGIPFDAFPIAVDPHHILIEQTRSRSHSETMVLSRERFRALMEHQDILVYVEQGYADVCDQAEIENARFHMARFQQLFHPDKKLYACHVGQDTYRFVDCSDVVQRSGGWQRLRYSYRINFAAIAVKGLKKVLQQLPPPDFFSKDVFIPTNLQRHYALRQLHILEGKYSSLAEPIALQLLFWLRKTSTSDREKLFKLCNSSTMEPSDDGAITFEHGIRNGRWLGTGKYEPTYRIGRLLSRVFWDARSVGLVCDYRNGKVELSEAGEAFLDSMHTDNNDPDAFLRFTDPATQTIPTSETERVDAWMMRFFRKMKTKVNAL